MAKFPHYHQLDEMSCGPTCLRIIARHFGRIISHRTAEDLTYKGKQGVSLLSICDAAENMGLLTRPMLCNIETLTSQGQMPFLAHWNQNHYVVVYKIAKGRVHISNPAARTLLDYSLEEFERHWASSQEGGARTGVAVFFDATPAFFQDQHETKNKEERRTIFHILSFYIKSHRTLLIQLCLGTLISSLFLFISPFLTQSLVDEGIGHGDHSFVIIFLMAQAILILGSAATVLIRGWLLLYLSSLISIELVTHFLQSVMKLPVRFFDKLTTGDVMQRLDDHKRIEHFLTSTALESFLSLIIIAVYAPILARFSLSVFTVFAFGTVGYIAWVLYFISARRRIDDRRFSELSAGRASEIELVQGITEIKLTGSEKQKRWNWQRIQIRLFKINIDSTKLEQMQYSGASLINGATLALASGLAAGSVIDGKMTLGTMLAISAMLGQMSVPLSNFIQLTKDAQDAQISLRRMSDLQFAEPEDIPGHDYIKAPAGDIVLENIAFRYGDPNASPVLDDVSLTIPYGKTTAIVGASGSGKTTLLKLLLKFYDPEIGKITVDGTKLTQIAAADWRLKCGVVMQDGFIFYDTIARNIAVTDDEVDRERLVWASEIANAREFIEQLPLGYNTKIGGDGIGLSGGQKQRVLIARAFYRQPDLLILDEATSALDAAAEAKVSRNFDNLTRSITKVIVAHRLSTVRHADQIIVLDKGRIAEIGNHATLTEKRGLYYNLIRNQLELGA